ncbi:MAG: hypothetical protein K2L02_00575 [Clostridia bacterium]|nr:hypothetical protein [Clostridia bacterium]
MLKKLLSIGAALIMGLCLFCGCDDKIDYLKEYDDGSQLQSVTAETEGAFYSLEGAYQMGFLSQRDLKKISYFHNADNNAAYPVELFSPVEAAIKNTYAEKYRNDEHFNSREITAEDFTVRSFYGYYYKCCVVTVDSTLWNYTTEAVDEWREICAVKFHFTNHGGITVWIPNKSFYTLTDAYKYGWFNEEDAKSIAYYHNGGREGNEEVMGEDFTPQPKTPQALDKDHDLEIRQDYFNTRFGKNNPYNNTVDEIGYRYYGCYNSHAVVKIWCRGDGAADVVWEEEVGGVKIKYTDGSRLMVWIVRG